MSHSKKTSHLLSFKLARGMAAALGVVSLWLAGCGEPPAVKQEGVAVPASKTATTSGTQTAAAPRRVTRTDFGPGSGVVPAPTPKPGPTPAIDRSKFPAGVPADADIAGDIEVGKRGGKLVLSTPTDPKTFNHLLIESASDQAIDNLQFSVLVGYDTYRQENAPGLAKSWEYDKDKRTWTFHLREGLKWSDGQPLTSDDFLFYTQVSFDPNVPNDQHIQLELDGKPYSFAAPDPLTLVATIPGEDAFAFENLQGLIAMPRHKLEKPWKDGKFNSTWTVSTDPSELVVSGPFKLKSMVSGQSIVMERNPYYFRYDSQGQQLPYLDEIVMLIVSDAEAEAVRFLAGETDIIDQHSLQASNLAKFMDEAKATKRFTVYELGSSFDSNHFFFNLNQGGTYDDAQGKRQPWQPTKMGEKPGPELKNFKPFVDPIKFSWFSNREFRIACSEASDRQAIIDTILFGLGEASYGPVPSSNREWYNPNITKFPYNPEAAKKRLEAAGFIDRDKDGIREDAQGHPIRFTLITNRNNPVRPKVANQLKENFKAIGFAVEVQIQDFNDLLTRLARSFDYDCCLMGLSTSIPPSPAWGANLWLSTGQMHEWYPQQKTPMTEFDAQIDKLFGSMKLTFDKDTQHKIYAEMQELFCKEQPSIELFSLDQFVAASNKIHNLKPAVLRALLTSNLDELFIAQP